MFISEVVVRNNVNVQGEQGGEKGVKDVVQQCTR